MTHSTFIHRLCLTTALGAVILTPPLALGMNPEDDIIQARPSSALIAPRTFDQDEQSDFVREANASDLLKIEIYLNQGMPVDAVNSGHMTALIQASIRGYDQIVALLLDKGAQINHQAQNGLTALIGASILEDRATTIDLLLNRGAKVDLRNKDGQTALIFASLSGQKNNVDLLLQKMADMNLQDKHGWTALMWASSRGYQDIVDLLLYSGAKMNLKNTQGRTALDVAKENNHTQIVALLESYVEREIWEERVTRLTDGGFLTDPTKARMPAADLNDFKHAITCSISFGIMRNPVRTQTTDSQGQKTYTHAYEREALEAWLKKSPQDPTTRADKKIEDYEPDTDLANRIREFMDQHAPDLTPKSNPWPNSFRQIPSWIASALGQFATAIKNNFLIPFRFN